MQFQIIIFILLPDKNFPYITAKPIEINQNKILTAVCARSLDPFYKVS